MKMKNTKKSRNKLPSYCFKSLKKDCNNSKTEDGYYLSTKFRKEKRSQYACNRKHTSQFSE